MMSMSTLLEIEETTNEQNGGCHRDRPVENTILEAWCQIVSSGAERTLFYQ